jgi:NAD(P)-dependent dehydrogenase (short-subunit alcohol dehydrogenase family)
MAVNFRHQYFAAQAVLPQMRALGFGSIINMSSVAWMAGGPSMQAYSAAKAAVVGFTNSLARDVGKWRIRVNAIAPGMVITPRQRALWYQDEALIAAGRARQAISDPIEPEDIAALGLFLAADDSRLITKQCFSVNGGSR